MLRLSYTAAKRFDRCPKLWELHAKKLTPEAVDQTPFLMGSVVHRCWERWLEAPQRSMADFLLESWVAEEMDRAGSLPWKPGERVEVFSRAALKVLPQLEADSRRLDLDKLTLRSEQKHFVELSAAVGMYAQPDGEAEHPTAPVLYVVELKSGSSYDPGQVGWYAAVITIERARAGLPRLIPYAVALRPARVPSVEIREVTQAEMQAQVDRVMAVSDEMLGGRTDPKPGSYCGICEARALCPYYQATFGRLTTTGKVGFG